MALHTLVRRNYGGRLPVSIKCHSLHSFKEGVILLCQSLLETRQISHLYGWALFTISFTVCLYGCWLILFSFNRILVFSLLAHLFEPCHSATAQLILMNPVLTSFGYNIFWLHYSFLYIPVIYIPLLLYTTSSQWLFNWQRYIHVYFW